MTLSLTFSPSPPCYSRSRASAGRNHASRPMVLQEHSRPCTVLHASHHHLPPQSPPPAHNVTPAPLRALSRLSSESVRLMATLAVAAPLILPGGTPPAAALVKGYGPVSGDSSQEFKSMYTYSDYVETPSGLQYQDIRVGEGAAPAKGDPVVVDWDGYTIHRGFVIEAKLLSKGGAFQDDTGATLLRFSLEDGTMIPAVNEALSGMRAGGIRRILVRPGPLSYPFIAPGKQSFDDIGPRPSTLSGRRALDFVLKNEGNIDKTILLDLELLEMRPGGGAARRGPGHLVNGAGQSGSVSSTQWDSLGGSRMTNGLYDK